MIKENYGDLGRSIMIKIINQIGVSENKDNKVICIVVSFLLFSYQFKAISLQITIFLWFVVFNIL